MLLSKTVLLAFATSPFLSCYALTVHRRDSTPKFPYAANTSKDCTWWVDYDGSKACEQLLEAEWTNLEDFRRWVSPCSKLLSV